MHKLVAIICGAGIIVSLGCSNIELMKEGDYKINVLVDDQLFTSYLFEPAQEKPIFFPINSPRGNMIVRGFPMIKDIPGERQDHPHHQSCFFTYGDVNGIDFWAEPKDSTKDGKIVSRQILKMENGKGRGELVTTADWLRPDQSPILSQKQTIIFQAKKNARVMDFTITLEALDQPVTFYDTKEGMFGLRVTPSLQEGEYMNSNGQRGSQECWGQRAAWVALRGPVKDEKVVLAIFEHPQSVNHPTYWHVRDYGLFAANPFGRHIFTDKKEAPLNYTLQPGETAVFKYRVLVYSGDLSQAQLALEYEKYKKGEF